MKPIASLAVLLLAAASILAQGSPNKTPPSQDLKLLTDGHQWEYLVISVGKALFYDIDTAKRSGMSKTLIYSSAGLQFGQEAINMQSQIDTLGKFDWELVTVVGAIGGDQELVFKRHFDPSRSSREAQMIQDEAKALEAKRKATVPEEQLIDLDKAEHDKADAELQASYESKYKEYATKALEGGNKVQSVTAAYYNNHYGESPMQTLKVAITVDGTATLLKGGNKYRGSEADKLAEAVKDSVSKAEDLKPHGAETTIDIIVVVIFNGKAVHVGSAYAFGV